MQLIIIPNFYKYLIISLNIGLVRNIIYKLQQYKHIWASYFMNEAKCAGT